MHFSETMQILLVEIFFLGVLSLYIHKLFKLRFICASLGFWFAWVFVLTSSYYGEYRGWMNINPYIFQYVEKMSFGAFIGFFIADLVCFCNPKINVLSFLKLEKISIFVINKYASRVVNIIFILGMIALVTRIMQVGLSFNYLTEARQNFINEQDYSLLVQILSHLMSILTVLLILKGVKDSRTYLDIKGITKILLMVSPLYISNATRTFLLLIPLPYFLSFIISRSIINGKINLGRKNITILVFILTFIGFIFSIIGFFRGGYGEEFDILYTILMWPSGTIDVMDIWIDQAINSPPAYGYYLFNWPFDIVQRLGIINFSAQFKAMADIQNFFLNTNSTAFFIPRSILPDLILDFGVDGIIPGMILVGFVLQFISFFAGQSIVLQVSAVLSILGCWESIGSSSFGASYFVPIFWAFVLTWWLNRKYGCN